MADAEPAAVAAVRALLGKPLRVTVSDGRVVEGSFECLDDHGNIILRHAVTLAFDGGSGSGGGGGGGYGSMPGMILVPRRHIVRCEVPAAL